MSELIAKKAGRVGRKRSYQYRRQSFIQAKDAIFNEQLSQDLTSVPVFAIRS